MAHKVGQIISRGERGWLIRVYLSRDQETKKRNYRNRTIHGIMREAQAYLTRQEGCANAIWAAIWRSKDHTQCVS